MTTIRQLILKSLPLTRGDLSRLAKIAGVSRQRAAQVYKHILAVYQNRKGKYK